MTKEIDRCRRCQNLSEVLIDGYCEGCCDALGRRRPTARTQREPEPEQRKDFELVRTS